MREFQRDFAAAISAPVSGPLAVYRNTVFAGACAALADNYPVTKALLGDEMFAAVAADYVATHPPTSAVLAAYGAGFAPWAEEQRWAADVAYLPDVARIERLHIEALFAADAAPLDPSELRRMTPASWATARLRLHPATRFSWSPWPATQLWLAHQDETDAKLAWRAEGVLVSRPHLAVSVEPIDAPAFHFLVGMCAGETVAAAGTKTTAAFPTADLRALFARLLNRGAFAALAD